MTSVHIGNPEATRRLAPLDPNSIRPMREVQIKDTLTGELLPLDPGAEVGIYACGPTVYSRIHIGNARPFVVFSLLARFLRSEGYRTKLVINVTDINDKIYAAARELGEDSAPYAERMTKAYFADTDGLGLGRPDSEPLATETIGEILELIAELIDTGHAYESGGDVYFKVRSDRRVRQALQPPHRGHGPGRGGGIGLAQGGPARLRPLEGPQAR